MGRTTTGRSSQQLARGRGPAVLAACVVAGALLRLLDIDQQSLWFDEVYSLDMIHWPFGVMLTVRDGHPPLFHILLRGVVPVLGEHAGRYISALAGTATIPLVYVLGKRLFDRPTALLAAILLAISPLHVWYSREGRMYALYVMFTLLASIAVERVARRGRPSDYAAWALSAAAGLMTHYGFAAVLLVQVFFLGWLAWRRAQRGQQLAMLAVVGFVGLAAMVPLARELAGGPLGTIRGFTIVALPYTAFTFVTGFGVGPTLSELHWSPTLATFQPYAFEVGIAGLAVSLALFLAARSASSAGRWGAYAVLWLIVPALLLLVRSGLTGTAYNVRYVLASLPAFLLLVAYGLRQERGAVAVVTLVLVAGVSVLSISRDRSSPRYQREQMREAAAFLMTEAANEDRVVVAARVERRTLAYYLRRASGGRLPLELEALPVRAVDDETEAREVLDRLSAEPRATWLVFSREWLEDPNGELRRVIHERCPEALAAELAGVTIFRLDFAEGCQF